MLLLAAILAFQAATPPTLAPSTCPASPCLKVSWQDAGPLPGTAIMAVCTGSATGCGTPSAPGPNGWTEYSVAETTTAGTGIIPGLTYGAAVNVSVSYTPTGGSASAWSAPFPFQVGQAPSQVGAVPTNVTAVQQ
jgi:hypothetical protein